MTTAGDATTAIRGILDAPDAGQRRDRMADLLQIVAQYPERAAHAADRWLAAESRRATQGEQP